jgi:hypothetical protein
MQQMEAPEKMGHVFVDSLMDWGWRLGPSCHLHTLPGHEAELHAMATLLGIRRAWYQVNSSMPHYDLTFSHRLLAIRAGAIEVNRRQTVSHIRAWRAASARISEAA